MSELRVPSSNIWLGASAHIYTVGDVSHLSNVVINEAMDSKPDSIDGSLASVTYRFTSTSSNILDLALPAEGGIVNLNIDVVGFNSTSGDYGSWKSYWVISSTDGTDWVMAPGCGQDDGSGVYRGVGGFYTYDGSQNGPSMEGVLDGTDFSVEINGVSGMNNFTVTLTVSRV